MNEPVLAELEFQLQSDTSTTKTFLAKDKFPVVIPPKGPQIHLPNNIVTVSDNFNGQTITINHYSSSQTNISRPRNKFILSRNILSKVVKNCEVVSTDDISRIISKFWSMNNNGSLQFYFNYVSFLERCWHETYFPTYHYYPKKLVPDDALKPTKGQNLSVDVIMDGPQISGTFETSQSRARVNNNAITPFNPQGLNSKMKNPALIQEPSEPLQFGSEVASEILQYKEHGPKTKIIRSKLKGRNVKYDLEILKNGAEDIEDVNKYLNLCSSTFDEHVSEQNNEVIQPNKEIFPDDDKYKKFTMRFSLNKKKNSDKAQPGSTKKGFKNSVSKKNTKSETKKEKSIMSKKIPKHFKNSTYHHHLSNQKKGDGTSQQELKGFPSSIHSFNFEIIKSPFNFGKSAVEDIINHS